LAIVEELQGFERHGTWSLAHVPKGRKIVETKWVFRLKDADTPTPRYKARLVAKGYTQVQGMDYNEMFSPVVSATAVRTLIALAASNQMEAVHIDFEAAFLNGILTEEIYVTIPDTPLGESPHRYHDFEYKLMNKIRGERD
jgi:Reverse transcriptase (RNA-dependent DNA polymerase)